MAPTEIYNSTIERMICQVGISNGMRAIITTGEVNGIIEPQKASCELGSLDTDIAKIRAKIIGTVMGVCNWLASWIESTAEPTAANIAE